MFWLMFTSDEHVLRHRSGCQPIQSKGIKIETKVVILFMETRCKQKNVTLFICITLVLLFKVVK